MKPGILLSRIRFFAALLIFSLGKTIVAQEKPPLGTIAVLRMKNINMTTENKAVLKDCAERMNAALAASKLFDVPAERAVFEALDDEGIDPNDLIDLEEYLEVGKSLKTDFIVIGSISQQVMTFYAHARVYSVAEGLIKGIVSSDAGIENLSNLIDLLAHRIGTAIDHPTPVDTLYTSFHWSNEFRFAFGPDRLDLAHPAVHYVNQNPPFEISVKVSMDRLENRGTYVVTNFDIYADNVPIAAIGPEIKPPLLLRENEITINGHTFCFRADVKELRMSFGSALFGALINITGRYCK